MEGFSIVQNYSCLLLFFMIITQMFVSLIKKAISICNIWVQFFCMNYLHDLSDVGLGCWAVSLLLLGASCQGLC